MHFNTSQLANRFMKGEGMDVTCANCGEPYDTYHMRHDEPYEWDFSEAERKRFLATGKFEGKDDPALKAAEASGWKFAGQTTMAILHCPACKSQTPLRDAIERKQMAAIAADLMGDDADGIASMLEDMSL
ncbi:MAG TPA: hypothetical protein VK181_19605 [Rhizobium sp.]|nr:hypothetical protein [Rhizobium sp.]